eukprot:jgi/Bigna1/144193/aug1.85_g18901
MFAKFRQRKRKKRYRSLLDGKGRSEQITEASTRCEEKGRQQRKKEEGNGEIRGDLSLTSLRRDRCSKKNKKVLGEPQVETRSTEAAKVVIPLRATTCEPSTSFIPPPPASPSQIYLSESSIVCYSSKTFACFCSNSTPAWLFRSKRGYFYKCKRDICNLFCKASEASASSIIPRISVAVRSISS